MVGSMMRCDAPPGSTHRASRPMSSRLYLRLAGLTLKRLGTHEIRAQTKCSRPNRRPQPPVNKGLMISQVRARSRGFAGAYCPIETPCSAAPSLRPLPCLPVQAVVPAPFERIALIAVRSRRGSRKVSSPPLGRARLEHHARGLGEDRARAASGCPRLRCFSAVARAKREQEVSGLGGFACRLKDRPAILAKNVQP